MLHIEQMRVPLGEKCCFFFSFFLLLHAFSTVCSLSVMDSLL